MTSIFDSSVNQAASIRQKNKITNMEQMKLDGWIWNVGQHLCHACTKL